HPSTPFPFPTRRSSDLQLFQPLVVKILDHPAALIHFLQFLQLDEADRCCDVVQVAFETNFIHIVFPPIGLIDSGSISPIGGNTIDRKSTRLNSSHGSIS